MPAIDPKAVERPRDRTADTQTFDNPDGGWSPIDLNLQVGPDGRWAPRKAPTTVSFAPLANAGQVASAGLDGGRSLAYALRDAAPVPAGKLVWSKTYYWGVKTHDTVSPSPNWVGSLALTTRVPQPEITSQAVRTP